MANNICTVCEKEFSLASAKLGYVTCLVHAEKPKNYTIAPAYNKGTYQLISKKEVMHIGR